MNTTLLASNFIAALLAVVATQAASAAQRLAQRDASASPSVKALPPACPPTGPRSADALALRVVGLTQGSSQRLVCFRENAPQDAASIGFISGLQTDTRIEGIDYRVQDGLLYGFGNANGVYVLDTTTAVATLVNRVSEDAGLFGFQYSIDFDPAGDRLRIITDDSDNVRHDVNPGGVTVVDAPHNFMGSLTGNVVGAAYTNNDLSSKTASTLYAIDGTNLLLQSPANSGSLAAVGNIDLDVEFPSDVRVPTSMDIYSTLRDGVTVSNRALAIITIDDFGPAALFEINLSTGKSKFRGHVDAFDLAIPLGQR